jgi:hypothetical protein
LLIVVQKAKLFPSLVSFSRIPLSGRVFSIVKLDFYMLATIITQPLFMYTMLSFLLFNLILEKCFLSLNDENDKFFLALNFLGFFCLLVSCVLELLLLLFLFLLLNCSYNKNNNNHN